MGRRKKHSLQPETQKSIIVILLFLLGIISIASLFGVAGAFGIFLNSILLHIFGWGRFMVPFVILAIAFFIHKQRLHQINWLAYTGIFLFIISLSGLFHMYLLPENAWIGIASGTGGGYIGWMVSVGLFKLLGFWIAVAALVVTFVIAFLILFNTSLSGLVGRCNPFIGKCSLKNIKTVTEEDEEEYEGEQEEEEEVEDVDEYETEEGEIDEEQEEEQAGEEEEDSENEEGIIKAGKKGSNDSSDMVTGIPQVRFDASKIDLPLDLLKENKDKPTGKDVKNGSKKIQKTLENFGINVEIGGVKVGPTVTQYTFKPSAGVKLSRITALQDNLSLALAAHPLRIEAPIPGKPFIGIEVPNKSVAMVGLRQILESTNFAKRGNNMSIALGIDVSGKPWVVNLAKMPHLLVAGATGSGKSVCLNTIIVSLLYQNTPETLRLIMVDPKRVELPAYNGIPHLLTPVITDVSKTVNALKWAISEMDRRYDLLAQAGKREIVSYNTSVPKADRIPYLVIIIDELADLMMTAANEIETSIIRITQMARAVGIHMILATQRPSVNVITGLIKANVPARIAFSVASLMDSRTILDSSGAEKLIGRGDMLFLTADLGKPRRIQGAYLGDEEIKRVSRFLKEALELPVEYNEDIIAKQGGGKSSGSFEMSADDNGDELYEDAKDVVVQAGKASASLLQRRLRVGYSRAARLLDLLEENGIVGPSMGSKPREVYIEEGIE